MENSAVRVVVVEDSAPFRKFICSTLGKRPNLQVICELADRQKAVQKAEELKPDLILLDIGLPTLDGIEAAVLCPIHAFRRVRSSRRVCLSAFDTRPRVCPTGVPWAATPSSTAIQSQSVTFG